MGFRKSKNETEKVSIYGQILAAQSILYVLPTKQQLGEFVVEALGAVPGIKSAGLCIEGFSKLCKESNETCQDCSNLELLIAGKADFFCGFSEKEGFLIIPLETSFRRYGFLQIKEYGKQFVEYKPLVLNFANALAMTLENQWQQECLRTANIELEKHRNNLEELVEEQTGELRKLSTAIGQAFGSVIITDKNGKFEYVNQAFCKMTGFNHAEVIGKNPQLINSGKHPKQFFQELWETILSGHRWEGEICNKKKTGNYSGSLKVSRLFWMKMGKFLISLGFQWI